MLLRRLTTRKLTHGIALSFLMLPATVSRAFANADCEPAKLIASDPDGGAQFGSTVAMDGDTMAITALWDDNESGFGTGAVYVFRFDGLGWVEETKLISPDGVGDGGNYGRSLALLGNTLLVGETRALHLRVPGEAVAHRARADHSEVDIERGEHIARAIMCVEVLLEPLLHLPRRHDLDRRPVALLMGQSQLDAFKWQHVCWRRLVENGRGFYGTKPIVTAPWPSGGRPGSHAGRGSVLWGMFWAKVIGPSA